MRFMFFGPASNPMHEGRNLRRDDRLIKTVDDLFRLLEIPFSAIESAEPNNKLSGRHNVLLPVPLDCEYNNTYHVGLSPSF